MSEELKNQINKLLGDKEVLKGTGVVRLRQLKKLFEQLQQNSIKTLTVSERMLEAINREMKRRGF